MLISDYEKEGKGLSEYAWQEACSFIFQKETILEDDYPINYDYAYVAVFEDGEVKVVSSDIQGRVSNLKRDLFDRFKKNVAQIRRCELIARRLTQETS